MVAGETILQVEAVEEAAVVEEEAAEAVEEVVVGEQQTAKSWTTMTVCAV